MAAGQPARVLLREKAFRNDREQPDVEANGRKQDKDDEGAVAQHPVEAARVSVLEPSEEVVARPRSHRRDCGLRNRAHSIGVVVKERRSETRTATERVTANSRNRRPSIPPMKRTGTNTAISEMTDRHHGESHLARAADGGFKPSHSAFDVARNVLEHDDRVVDDESGGDDQRHQRKIIQAEAQEIHHAKGGDDRHCRDNRRNERRASIPQKQEDDQSDEENRDD